MYRTPKSYALKAVSAGGLAACLVATGALPAAATSWTNHTVQTVLDGAWTAAAKAKEHEQAGGIEYWADFRIDEIRSPWSVPSNLICSYQAGISWQSPSGSTTYDTQYSSFHQGCSYFAYFDFQNYEGGYVENTRFPTKWRSNHTPGENWVGIGTLRD